MAGKTIEIGLKGEDHLTVVHENTAAAYASDAVEVFATPAMIGLMEGASFNAIKDYLEEGQTSVGTRVDVRHLAATPLGHKVRAEAEVIEVEGKRVVFQVVAYDELEKIGEGQHERFIVDFERFISRVSTKTDHPAAS